MRRKRKDELTSMDVENFLYGPKRNPFGCVIYRGIGSDGIINILRSDNYEMPNGFMKACSNGWIMETSGSLYSLRRMFEISLRCECERLGPIFSAIDHAHGKKYDDFLKGLAPVSMAARDRIVAVDRKEAYDVVFFIDNKNVLRAAPAFLFECEGIEEFQTSSTYEKRDYTILFAPERLKELRAAGMRSRTSSVIASKLMMFAGKDWAALIKHLNQQSASYDRARAKKLTTKGAHPYSELPSELENVVSGAPTIDDITFFDNGFRVEIKCEPDEYDRREAAKFLNSQKRKYFLQWLRSVMKTLPMEDHLGTSSLSEYHYSQSVARDTPVMEVFYDQA